MKQRYLVDFDLPSLDRQVADFLVIGSGVAGLFAALKASQYGRVTLLTKDLLEGNTRYAQGGVAAAIANDDTWQAHLDDTLKAGAGLCNEEAVSILVQEGPDRIRDLIALGAKFDTEGGAIALTREGGHSQRRVLHAGGDATGEEIERTLARAALERSSIQVVSESFAIDLLTDQGHCYGALAFGPQRKLTAYLAKATIIASGGAGQVYAHTTNSPLVTGDGIAMAYRASAEVMDMEFFQFHPTGLKVPGAPSSLITEAVRGEGALLLDVRGHRFMPAFHEMAELAPRDIVARAIVKTMQQTGSDHVYLDMRHMQEINLPQRFPTVYRTCIRHGIDVETDLIPVAPVAHYFMGGIRVNYQGRTNIRGLYACGEAACLGLHGANRLASNSLLDGLVFGHRIAECAHRHRLHLSDESLLGLDLSYSRPALGDTPDPKKLRSQAQAIMWNHAGLVRSGDGLAYASEEIGRLQEQLNGKLSDVETMETANLLTVGQLIVRAATIRQESRGGHYREDLPLRNDNQWHRHIVLQSNEVRYVSV